MSAHPQRTPTGEEVFGRRWGISKHQVREFVAECHASNAWNDADTVRDFVRKFVKPRTQGTGLGVALLLNRDAPRDVNLMISHAWDENAVRFFEDIERHTRDDENMFICFLAIYQCEDGFGPSIAEQLGSDVHSGPFAEVIEHLKPSGLFAEMSGGWLGRSRGRMLVITCEECHLYSRLWCVWEAYVALTRHVPVEFIHRGRLFCDSTSSSRQARCGDPSQPMNADERRIRKAIENLPVETWRSRLGNAGAVLIMLAAIAVPLGLSAGWALGLSIAGVAVSGVWYGFSILFGIMAPFVPAGSAVASWILLDVLGKVGTGLLVGAGALLLMTVAGSLFCCCTLPQRRIRSGGKLSARLVDNRDGYARLDSVVRRAAQES